MSNNKQSSVEMMWNEIDNLFPFRDSEEAQKFCAILDKYKEIHKHETIKARQDGRDFVGLGYPIFAKYDAFDNEEWYKYIYGE